MVLFGGNELSTGVVLSSWLFWTAAGSIIASKVFRGRKAYSKDSLAGFIFLYALLIIITFFFIRCINVLIGVRPGEIFGILPIWVSSFCILAPMCFVSGAMFSFSCRVAEGLRVSPHKTINAVYIFEALGAVAGGLIVSFILIKLRGIFISGGIFLVLASLSVCCLLKSSRRVFSILSLLFSFIFLVVISEPVEKISEELRWKGFQVEKTVNSIYGNIAVTKERGQKSLLENGILNATVPDERTAEYAVQIPLLEHPLPEKILMVGGGLGGGVEEALKHPSIENLDYIELDPELVKVARKYIKDVDKSLSRKKVRVIFSDARRWVEKARDRYDVIIVNLPDPVNARINRMYTREFFYFAKERLNPGGIFAFSISVSENYINRESQSLITCLYETVNSVFNDVIIIPGELLFYIASDKKGILTQDASVLEKRVKERNLDLKYVRQYYLSDCLSPWRIKYFEDSIKELSCVRINTDYSPVCYYYGEVYWSTLFANWFRGLLVESGKIKLWWFLAVPVLIFILRIFINKPTGFPVLFAVFSSGFAEIMFQVLIIIMFQTYYGYLYYRLGVLVTSFMIGLVMGAYIAGKINTGKNSWRVFVLSQIGMCVYPLLLPVIFLSMHSIGGTSAWYWEYMVFPILPVIAGFVGGVQFPLANRLYLKRQKGLIGKVSGLTYGLDVFGSFFGALIGSAILIPLLGIFQSCAAASIISTSALVSLFIFKQDKR